MSKSNVYCSPTHSKNTETCYDNKSLIKIATKLNSSRKKHIKIPNSISKNGRKKIWNSIKKNIKYKDKCSEDYCIANTDIVKSALSTQELKDTFRPVKPPEWNYNERKWLSTLDIKPVMKQYEKVNKDFKFIGPVPIDFDYKTIFGSCVSEDLCKINIKKLLSKNIKKLGVVFNLDPHYKSGSHWTALYTNFDNGGIYYFDSYGVMPPREVQNLMIRIKTQANTLLENNIMDINSMENTHMIKSKYKFLNDYQIEVDNPDLFLFETLIYFGKNKKSKLQIDPETANMLGDKNGKVLTFKKKLNKTQLNSLNLVSLKSFRTFYNNRKFQLKNTECGVYSMNFVERLLNGESYDDFINNIIRDDQMHQNRNKYFSPNTQEI